MANLITLLTDFGHQDVYIGVMKGVIAQINPELKVMDLTHEIPPQDLAAARFNLLNAYAFFPTGTVHVVVVDPGVGTTRRAIAVQFSQGFLVGPDNGVFSGVLQRQGAIAAVELTNPDFWAASSPSATFHGRDIFAPVGAYLASGVALVDLGETIDPQTLVKLNIPNYIQTESGITGAIQYIDHFGNLITTIPGELVQGLPWTVQIGPMIVAGTRAYGDRPIGALTALVGSHSWIEIAINGGSAKQYLQARIGDPIQVWRAYTP